jgi:CrcB protein
MSQPRIVAADATPRITTVGICGGFTTFSAFAYNNFTMIKEHSYGQLLFNLGGNIFLGILAVYVGIIVIRAIF